MRSRSQIIDQLTNPGIIAVIRTSRHEHVIPVCQALVDGGVFALEITLTVPNALHAIQQARTLFGDSALIGAGTVVRSEQCHEVISAGAEFVVSPITRPELVEIAHAADRPIMLGAYTPTEAQTAYEAGADFVKLFPADQLGPTHVKSLLAPLPHLRIVPTGGVNLETAEDFLRAGCAALGVGSSLLSREILENEDWAALTRLASAYGELARKASQAIS